MSQQPPLIPVETPDAADDLQFATVEPAIGTATAEHSLGRACLVCRRPIETTYYSVGSNVLCPACNALVQAPPPGNKFLRVMKATLMGAGAGLVGTIIWFVVRRFAHLEIGLIAVLVGFLVGKTVRKASGGRGGRGYQILAVIVTYACISANYMPDLFVALVDGAKTKSEAHVVPTAAKPGANQSSGQSSPRPTQTDPQTPGRPMGFVKMAFGIILLIILVFVFSLAAPVISGLQSPIGFIIVGIALWEAWKFNTRPPISGPYQVGGGRPMPPPAPGAVSRVIA